MKTILRSTDLNCPSCAGKIERALKNLDGVTDAAVHFTTGRIIVVHDPTRTNRDVLIRTVEAIGYRSKVVSFS